MKITCTKVVPRPLSNDPRFIQCIYRYSRASKRFVEIYFVLIAEAASCTKWHIIERTDPIKYHDTIEFAFSNFVGSRTRFAKSRVCGRVLC